MTIGKLERDGLIAGNYPLVAAEVVVRGSATNGVTEFKRGDVIALINGTTPALVNSAAATTDGRRAVGIMCDNVAASAGEQRVTTMYIKGEFNHRALRFGGTDTSANHMRHMTEIGLIVRETRI